MAEDTETKSAPISSNEPDWFLAHLVSMTNGPGKLRIPITLTVGGMLITGMLTSGAEYHNDFAERISKGFNLDAEGTEDIRQSFAQHADIYATAGDGEPLKPTFTEFVHIKDAKYLVPGSRPILGSGNWWRGRLRMVDGFHLGRLEESPE